MMLSEKRCVCVSCGPGERSWQITKESVGIGDGVVRNTRSFGEVSDESAYRSKDTSQGGL